MFKTSEQTDLLAQALADISKEIDDPVFDKVNPHFKSKYASLPSFLKIIRKTASKHGVCLYQNPIYIGVDTFLCTRVMHKSGQFIESSMKILLSKQDMQGLGSALTYARRQAAGAAFNICGDEDDDGNSIQEQKPKKESSKAVAPPPSNKITEAQAKELYNLGINGGYTAQEMISALKATVGVDKWNSVPASEYERLKGLFSISNIKG